MSKILVLKGKHADEYFIYESPEELNAIALSVLRERQSANWFSSAEEVRASMARELKRVTKSALEAFGGEKLSEEEREALPEKVREQYDAALSKGEEKEKRIEAHYSEELNFAERLEELLALPLEQALRATFKNQRGRRFYRASYLLEGRSDFEYEGYETVTPDVPEELKALRAQKTQEA